MTARGLAVGAAGIVLNCCLMFHAEEMRRVWLSNAVPFANVIFLLFLLTGLNALVRRVFPRLALGPADLLVVYAMLSVQTGLSSAHCIHWLMGSISYGPWAAALGKDPAASFLGHLPSWLLVGDSEALRGYHLGQTSLFAGGNLRAWLGPVVWWTLLLWGFGAVFLAVAALFSSPWIHQERLSYPVAELPFRMVAPEARFWGQPLMWAGFALAAGAEGLNGLSFLYPAVPSLPLRRTNLGPMFPDPPWNALGETNLSFYPFIIGLCYVIPLDLSVSLWAFYLLHKSQLVLGSAAGWSHVPNFPFTREQQLGAGAAIVVGALWASRAHLRRVARIAWGAPGAGGTPGERRQYRACLAILVLGTVGVPLFMVAAGLPPWIAFVIYGSFVFMGLMVSRIRCELGFPMHDLVRMNGASVLMLAHGSQALGDRSVTLMALFNTFTLANQNHVMPHQFEALKLAERGGIRPGAMSRAIAAALFLAVPLTFLVYLELTYRFGADSAHVSLGQSGRSMWEQTLPAWARSDVYRQPNLLSLAVIAGSFLFGYGLLLLRLRFAGWPLHPLGLTLANSDSGVGDVVCAVFVASALKGATLYFGGLRAYRTFLPFFLGMMLGDLVAGMAWVVGGILSNTPTYVFFL